jgi:hypothetical protein
MLDLARGSFLFHLRQAPLKLRPVGDRFGDGERLRESEESDRDGVGRELGTGA